MSSNDTVIEEVRDRGTLKVGLGLFEPWSACNADGELIGFEIDVAKKVAADMGVEVEFAPTNWSYIISEMIEANKASGWLDQRSQYWFQTREWEDPLATDPETIATCDESFE